MSSFTYALIHEENGYFGISFPDFPGVASGGATAEEAIAHGREGLTFHIAGMVEDGDPIPRLRGLNELREDPAFVEDSEGAALVMIPIDLPAKPVRINISIDESLLSRIDRAAKSRGETRSGYLANAAKARLVG